MPCSIGTPRRGAPVSQLGTRSMRPTPSGRVATAPATRPTAEAVSPTTMATAPPSGAPASAARGAPTPRSSPRGGPGSASGITSGAPGASRTRSSVGAPPRLYGRRAWSSRIISTGRGRASRTAKLTPPSGATRRRGSASCETGS